MLFAIFMVFYYYCLLLIETLHVGGSDRPYSSIVNKCSFDNENPNRI